MEKYTVKLERLTKDFGGENVVEDISLDVKHGEFLTLLGPSGCGKSTTLRMIAGFENPTSGKISIDGEVVNKVEPYNREINMVFQNYSLFPHMTIFNNVAFGLKMKKKNKKEVAKEVNRVLKMVQLENVAKRKPDQLSGGQQQRIAIARAIVNNPKVLLLDEPLGALDLKLRKKMQLELKHLQQSLGITFIYVTHDQDEALTMSDRIVVMNKGKIEQLDTSRRIYEKPQSLFVAGFIGETNILNATVIETTEKVTTLQIEKDNVYVSADKDIEPKTPTYLSIRPENIICSTKDTGTLGQLEVFVKEVIYSGSITKMITELPDKQELTVHSNKGSTLEKNDKLFVHWEPAHATIHHIEEAQV